MQFHEKLIQLRKQRGLSQEQLGEQVGVSRQTVSKWELGLTTPEMDKLIQLSCYFEISLDELAGREAPAREPEPQPGQHAQEPGTYLCRRWHYEYKSRRTVGGLPLVHINVGMGAYRAKGVLAVGNLACGVVSLGFLSAGVLAVGPLAAGLLAIGGGALGLLLAVGGLALGAVAVGGLAAGLLAIGGGAFGVYTIGGLSIASRVALGGFAQAPIAIGGETVGQITFDTNSLLPEGAVRAAILEKFPDTWEFLADLFGAAS